MKILPNVKYFGTGLIVAAIFYQFLYGYTSSRLIGVIKYILSDANKCLLKNLQSDKLTEPPNCDKFDAVSEVKKLYDATYSEIHYIYLQQETPVIVIDAMFEWDVMKYPITLENFTKIFEKLTYYSPCEIYSNVVVNTIYINDYLSMIKKMKLESWHLIWRNCNVQSAKYLRKFYQQPYFLKYFQPAANRNQIFISKSYMFKNYKQINKERRIILVMQIRGHTKYKLVAKSTCNERVNLTGILETSQILITQEIELKKLRMIVKLINDIDMKCSFSAKLFRKYSTIILKYAIHT